MVTPPSYRSVYLITTAGHPNYGDELIVRTWLRRIAAAYPEAVVWLDSPNPGIAAALFSGLHPQVRCTDTVWQLCRDAPRDDPSPLARFVADSLTSPDSASRLVPGIDHLRRAGIVHLIGGGFVNDIWRRNFGLVAALWWASRRAGTVTALTGAGLVPAVAPRGLFATLLAGVDVVDVRDPASSDLLDGVAHRTMSGDDSLLDLEPPADAGDLPDTMVCLQGDLVAIDREELLAWTLRVLRRWGVANDPVGFVECIPRVDREAFNDLAPYLPGARLYTLWDLLDKGFPARPGQRWITTRFHPHLLAAARGAAGVAVTIDPVYYHNKHRSLFEAGTGWANATDEEGAFRDPGSVGATRASSGGSLAMQATAKRQLADRLYGGGSLR